MLGSVKRKYAVKNKTSCEATLVYREAHRYFSNGDKMRAGMKRLLKKAERRSAKAEIQTYFD